jgi:hypothetical protein
MSGTLECRARNINTTIPIADPPAAPTAHRRPPNARHAPAASTSVPDEKSTARMTPIAFSALIRTIVLTHGLRSATRPPKATNAGADHRPWAPRPSDPSALACWAEVPGHSAYRRGSGTGLTTRQEPQKPDKPFRLTQAHQQGDIKRVTSSTAQTVTEKARLCCYRPIRTAQAVGLRAVRRHNHLAAEASVNRVRGFNGRLIARRRVGRNSTDDACQISTSAVACR